MALDNGFDINKQLPQFPDGTISEQPDSTVYADDWPMEKVVQWLKAHGWGAVAPLFELNGIEGQGFLDLTMTKLAKVIPRSDLAYGDKRRLLHGIHSIQASQGKGQQEQGLSKTQVGSENNTSTLPSHYLDTTQDGHSILTGRDDTIQYTSPISTIQTPQSTQPPSTSSTSQVPQLSYPTMISNGSTSSTSSTTSTNVSPLSAASLESEYAKIRPYIPERKSSNPVQISKIMKQFNVPPTLPLARTRPNPIIARRTNNGNQSQHRQQQQQQQQNRHLGPPSTFQQQQKSSSPISPRQLGDMDGGWKISRRPGVNKSKQDSTMIQQSTLTTTTNREQRIQVTLDSDTFFSLTVTNITDPIALKMSIVKKLGMTATSLEQYQFYHENGDNSDIPLDDDQLVYICGHSDNSKHRILLKSTSPLINMESTSPSSAQPSIAQQQQQQQQQQEQQTVSLWAVPPRSLQTATPPSPRQSEENQTESVSAPLWAVPPQPIQHRVVDDQPISAPLWAVPPRPLQPVPQEQMAASLWAVPPSQNTTSLSSSAMLTGSSSSSTLCSIDHNDVSNTNPTPSSSASLWAIPPKPSNQHPSPMLSPSSSTTSTSTRTSTSASLWAIPPKNIYQDQEHQQSQQSQDTLSSGLWAVPPRLSPSNSSSTSSSVHDSSNTNAKSTIPTSSSSSISSSLWAIPPQSLTYQEQQHGNGSSIHDTSGTSDLLEGMRLEDPPVTITSSSSSPPVSNTPALRPSLVTSKSSTSIPRSQKRLQIQIPSSNGKSELGSPKTSNSSSPGTNAPCSSIPLSSSISRQQLKPQGLSTSSPSVSNALRTPQSSSENGSPISSSQDLTDTEEDNWAERPSIERLYRDIDKYLPGHDLDKEIMLEGEHATTTSSSINTTQSITNTNNNTTGTTPPPQSSLSSATLVSGATPPLTRRLQGHKKSIRVVAKEAHRNWRQAVNVIRVNNILRRRSTKMWGHKVQQVKPGMALANEKEDNTTTLHDGKPAPTKLQWMRGQLIGKGSYGRVYHALNVAAGEWIAVKQVDIPTTSSDRHNQQLHDTADALYREIQLLKDLEHDNIVQYLGYDVDEEEGHINIFLEYVPGGSIASCLSKQGKFEESLVSYFTRQILLGLEYLHDRNILHRDIKAGNVLLTHTGTCKITDFGLSKLSGQDKAYDAHGNNSVMRGTVFWMAPEVVSGTNYNAKVDIWSLGCTVIEMLTGKHPWLDMNMLAALYSLGRFEAPPIPEGIHENAKSFLKQCFTINPEERPTAADLLVHPFVGQNPSFKFKDYMKN